VSLEGACPDDETLLAFVENTLAAEARDAFAAHAEACLACCELLTRFAHSAGAGREAGGDSPPSRYKMLSVVGAGGMGIVQAAFDRELGRRVALKFLSSDPSEEQNAARSRLLREAQALAKLSHPNVITVYDVGIIDDEVFLAMELVDGKNLRQWLADSEHAVAETVDVLRQAGEGLAAAHDAGFVHLDFKPENVLVGDDGRVRVSDFGLARSMHAGGPTAPSAEPGSGATLAPTRTLTRTGAQAGTPAYMAPEQRLGRSADVRSDVYSFCVTLYEAVTGSRPDQGGRMARGLPRWLGRALARGLHEDPAERWPSMRPLLRSLVRGPLVTWPRIAAAAGSAGLVLLWILRPSSPPVAVASPCAPDASAFVGVWDPPRREAVLKAFRAAAPEQAEFAFHLVDGAFERLKEQWIGMRADSCLATRVRRDQSEAALDLRSACLDGVRTKARALADVLTKADRAAVERAPLAGADLPSVDPCANVRALQAVVPLPQGPGERERVADVEERLAKATALRNTGGAGDAFGLLEPALETARELGATSLEAKVLVLQADTMMELIRPEAEITATAHLAAQRALKSHDDASAASAWILMMWETRFRGGGPVWGDYAEVAIERVGGDDFLEAERCTRLGQVRLIRGEYDEARALFERAKPLYEKTRGPDYYRIGSDVDGLGNVALEVQHPEEALALFEAALALRRRVTAPFSGHVVASTLNLFNTLIVLGRLEQAEHEMREFEVASDGGTAYLDWLWGLLERAKGDYAAALERDRRSIARWEHGRDPESSDLATPRTGLGLDFLALGRPGEALAPLERALAVSGADRTPFERAQTLFALARALTGAGRDASRATALANEAAALLEPLARRYGGDYAKQSTAIDAFVASRVPLR
jgi:tetratricopeptide (TPR) repeat protein